MHKPHQIYIAKIVSKTEGLIIWNNIRPAIQLKMLYGGQVYMGHDRLYNEFADPLVAMVRVHYYIEYKCLEYVIGQDPCKPYQVITLDDTEYN